MPAGAYHIYQHLIAEPKTYELQGRTEKYTSPLNAWGGIPVTLVEGQTASLKDFIEYSASDLEVTVHDARGAPVHGATLRVRDRMSEAWRQVAEGPTTLSNAAHPIPYPPAVRVREGHAKLPSIRADRLELVVELDDGRMYPFTVSVAPPGPLALQLPVGGDNR